MDANLGFCSNRRGGQLLLNCSMIVIGLTFLYTCICEWLAEDIILVLV